MITSHHVEKLRTPTYVYFTSYEWKVVYDRSTGRSRGFGFITFTSEDSMNRAIGMNGKDFDGRSVMVMKSESRSKRNDGDRSSGRERHDRNDSEDRHNHHGSSYDDRSRDRSRERDDYRSNRSYDDSNKIIVLEHV